MTVRVGQPASAPSKNRMGGNEDLNDFKGEKMKNFANTNAFDAGVKEKTHTDQQCERFAKIRQTMGNI
jgi:hypothetical protein